MPLTKAWELDFNTGTTAEKRALVRKFYMTPDAFNGDPANLRLNSDSHGSFMTSTFGAPEVGATSFQDETALQAATPTNGRVGYCYDEDPALNGRRVANGTAWGARTGDVRGAGWNDPNHNIRGNLTLHAQGWSQAGHAAAPADRRPFPANTDLRGGELRYRMRLRDFFKPEAARLCQHIQTHAPELDADGWNPAVQQAWVNMLQVADPLDNQLGFGRGGFYDRSPVAGVKDSKFRDVTVRLSTDDRFWMQLGGQPGRQGMPGEDVRFFNYVCGPAETVLGNWTGNMMIVGFYPTLDQAARNEPVPVDQRMRGHIDIQKIELWLPS